MAQMQFDESDTAMIAIVVLASAVMAKLATFSAFGTGLSDTFNLLGGTFSLAYILTLGAFVWTIVTNGLETDPQSFANDARNQLDDTYYYLLLGSIGLLALWPFVGGISDFIVSADIWGVLFIAASTAAQIAIGYMR